jgi:hypothetical protein
MMERRKLWQLPARYQQDIIDLALVSNDGQLAEQIREASRLMDLSNYLRSENTFSHSVQKKLDQLFASSIDLFNQASSGWGLRMLWCSQQCAGHPNQHIWAFSTHPFASDALIDHACSCARCLGTAKK